MILSNRLQSLDSYAFADVEAKVQKLRDSGIAPIDFGVGDPTEPTPEIIRNAIKKGVDAHACGGYPSYIGSLRYREAIADWMLSRFSISVDVNEQIAATIGSKEAVFHFPECLINPGDIVLVPNPGYPPYERGTLFAEGHVYYMNLLPENNFMPDLNAIPEDICHKAKLIWVNYPNNPTGVCATDDFYNELIEFAKKYNIVIASDEAYIENYYGQPPRSILEFTTDNVIAFYSLSKRSCMTGYRIGWVAGDSHIISAFKKLKTNIDSGTPSFVQDAAIAALSDESHVQQLRQLYRKKRDIMMHVLSSSGFDNCQPEATLYIWQKVSDQMSDVDCATQLLNKNIAVVTTPGSWVAADTSHGNPGKGYIRWALVPDIATCELAASRIYAHWQK